MKELNLAEAAIHMASTAIAVRRELEHGLERVAQRVEKTAKDEIGHYQAAIGPFQAWSPLADSTEERKAALGYPAGSPLLASGEMQDSITHQVEGLEAVIGSPDEKLVFHEFGTSKMPPRPVMGPAALRNREVIEKLVGAAVVAGLVGADQVHAALGYDFET